MCLILSFNSFTHYLRFRNIFVLRFVMTNMRFLCAPKDIHFIANEKRLSDEERFIRQAPFAN